MRITRLELQHIGPFEHQIFDFNSVITRDKAEIHIFSGVNGSGKSTVLYALASGFDPFSSLRNRFRFADSRSCLRIRNSDEDEELIRQYKDSGEFAYISSPRKFTAYRNIISSNYSHIPLDFAVFAYSGFRSLSSVNLQAIQEVQVNPLKDSLDFRNPVNSQILLQWVANTKAKEAFASQEKDNQRAERYRISLARIEEAVRKIIGDDVRFTFRYEPLNVGIKINNEELEFDVLADGLKSVISWIADLLMRLERIKWADDRDVLDRNFILLLDEIEIHLHPAWQRKILPVVQQLFKNAQIFIATHSPFVVGSVSDARVYKLSVSDGKSGLSGVTESAAGNSYPTVLDEIFGIDEYFDVETEKEFARFYEIRQEIFSDNTAHIDEFSELARKLALKSVEVRDIVGRELRQLQRNTGREISL